MIMVRSSIKILFLFLSLSMPMCPIFWWTESTQANIPVPPHSDNNLFISSQTIAKGSVDARTIVIQGGIISDISKIFDPNNLTTASSTFQMHYFKIIAASLLTSYIWILYQIRYTCLLMKQHNAWCNWKAVTPVTHLQLTAQSELLSQLKIDMYKKYARHAFNHASCDHTATFIQDINAELQVLDTYLNWQQRMQTLACTRLFNFPFETATIEEKKTRLFFLLDFFMTAQAEKL